MRSYQDECFKTAKAVRRQYRCPRMQFVLTASIRRELWEEFENLARLMKTVVLSNYFQVSAIFYVDHRKMHKHMM